MKQYYCQSCLFDKHEIMVCAIRQLKWELEQAAMQLSSILGMPLGKQQYSYCEHFEQVDLGEDE